MFLWCLKAEVNVTEMALQESDSLLKMPLVASTGIAQAKALYSEGKILFQQKQYPQALEKLLEAKALTSENYFCRVLIAKVMEQIFPFHTVDEFYKKSLELAPESHKYFSNYAVFLSKQGHLQKAILYYKKAISLSPETERYSTELNKLLLKAKTVESNDEHKDKTVDITLPSMNITQAKILYTEGKKLFQDKKYPEAFEKLSNAMALTSENYFCRVLVAKVVEKVCSVQETHEFHKKSVLLEPDNHKYLSTYAVFLAKQNLTDESVAYYKQAIALAPEVERYHTELVKLLSDAGRNDEVIEAYKKMVDINPHNSKGLTNLGNMLAKNEQHDEAESYFIKASLCENKDDTHLIGLSSTLIQQRKYAEALPLLLEAIKKFPDKYPLYLRLADIYTGLKRHTDAIVALDAYLKIDPKKEGIVRRKIVHAQLAEKFTVPEQRIRFFAINSFHTNKPALSSVQKRVVEEALDTGFSLTSVEELFDDSDKTMIQKAIEQVMDFRHSKVALDLIKDIKSCDDFSQDPQFAGTFKPSVVNFINNSRAIRADDAMAQMFLSRKILDIANYYNGMLSKVRNINLWINPSIKGKNVGVRKGSQIWHRDQEDEKILKCFIYLTDVGPNSGALDYVPFSKCIPDRKFSDLHPYPFSTGYPGEYIFSKYIGKETITASCKKGSIAFVDTNGFHRGGYVTENERIVLMATYLRPTSPYVHTNTHLESSGISTTYYDNDVLYAIS